MKSAQSSDQQNASAGSPRPQPLKRVKKAAVAPSPPAPASPPAERHTPLPLSTDPAPTTFEILRAAIDGRAVFYVGAGLSMAHPACGPKGPQVANRLRPFVAELLSVPVDEVKEPDLESLAARVESAAEHRLPDLKRRAAESAEFRTMAPNYGHEIVALLMREGAITGVSANWDRGIENAGLQMNLKIEGVADAQERLQPERALPLYKVHGCAERPSTLAITREEVDKPQAWARAKVADALAGGMVVFLGLGTVGVYVTEPIDAIVKLWASEGATIRIVDPGGMSDAWQAALGDATDGVGIPMFADAFLDDLVRALVREALSKTAAAVRELDDGNDWAKAMLGGYEALREAVSGSPANGILRWWRDGVTSDRHGQPFVLDTAGCESLMAASLVAGHDGGPVEVAGGEEDLTIQTQQRYIEIAAMPGVQFKDIDRHVRERVRRGRSTGRLAPGKPVAVAVHGGRGTFPALSAPPDIGAEDTAVGDIGGETIGDVCLVRADRAISGELSL